MRGFVCVMLLASVASAQPVFVHTKVTASSTKPSQKSEYEPWRALASFQGEWCAAGGVGEWIELALDDAQPVHSLMVSAPNVKRFTLRVDGGAPVEHELPYPERPGMTWKTIPIAGAVKTLRVTIAETRNRGDTCANLGFSHAMPAYAGRDDAFAALQPAMAAFYAALTACDGPALARLTAFPIYKFRSATAFTAACKQNEVDVFGDSKHVGDCAIDAVPDQIQCLGYGGKAHTIWTLGWRKGAWKLVDIREH
jgi:hypothetical protein